MPLSAQGARAVVLERLLSTLNPNQLKAVTLAPEVPLQIIAGPGTGKTSVLTSRVAYLLLEHNYDPHRIMVTTFTRKAAKEMTERLLAMIPPELGINLSRLLIGTFHSICVRLLRQNGRHIGLSDDFKVIDERDAKEVLKTILERPSKELNHVQAYVEELRKINKQGEFELNLFLEKSDKHNGFDLDKIRRHISSLKSQGSSASAYGAAATKSLLLSQIYSEYQQTLDRSSYVDFDDILLLTKKLLETKNCLSYLQHVLVDEFQDTDAIQLQLLYLFSSQSASHRDSVTIVGDPDQSIYAFRNAVAQNFQYMRSHYGKTLEVIQLTQNYRSVDSVLQISEKLMEQELDTERQKKTLISKFQHQFKTIYNRFDSNSDEAEFIASEIATLAKFPGLYGANDFAILVRSRFLSRAIEQALRKNSIKYKVVQGKAFWELKEIQIIIDYIRCVTSDTDKLAYLRVINFPPRGIGPKAMTQLETLMDSQQEKSAFDALQSCSKDSILSASTGKGVQHFLNTVDTARALAADGFNAGAGINAMFDYIVEQTNLIEKIRPDDPTTTENNIKEFKKELLEFEITDRSLPNPETGEFLEITDDPTKSALDLLTDFIESINIYEADEKEEEDSSNKAKVVISTIHGAKGLEWPVVFIPALTESFFPASWALKSEQGEAKAPTAKSAAKRATAMAAMVNEERRALYVAMTRAKTSLYLSGFAKKMFSGEDLEESRFLKSLTKHFDDRNTALANFNELRKLYEVNAKDFPDMAKTTLSRLISSYNDYHETYKSTCTNTAKPTAPLRRMAGFASAGNIQNFHIAGPKKQFYGTKRKSPDIGTFNKIKHAPAASSPYKRILSKSTSTTNKKSHAPSYKYDKSSFK